MQLEKNEELISNVCQVLIRSVDDVVDIPSLQVVYHTPSKISFNNSGRNTPNGTLHTKTLRLSYPGLSQTDFQKFNELIKGLYQVYIQLDNGDLHEVASNSFPMECTTDFSVGSGHELVFSSTSPFDIAYITTVTPGPVPPGVPNPGIEEMFNYDFDFNLN